MHRMIVVKDFYNLTSKSIVRDGAQIYNSVFQYCLPLTRDWKVRNWNFSKWQTIYSLPLQTALEGVCYQGPNGFYLA